MGSFQNGFCILKLVLVLVEFSLHELLSSYYYAINISCVVDTVGMELNT